MTSITVLMAASWFLIVAAFNAALRFLPPYLAQLGQASWSTFVLLGLFGAYALAGLGALPLVRRFGLSGSLIGGGAVLAAIPLAAGLGLSPLWICLAAALSGAGMTVWWAAYLPALWRSADGGARGRALGRVSTSAATGGLVGVWAAGQAIPLAGFYPVMLAGAAVSTAGAALLLPAGRLVRSLNLGDTSPLEVPPQVRRVGPLLLLGAIGGGVFADAGILTLYRSLTPQWFAAVVAANQAAGLLCPLLSGRLADRYGPRPVMSAGFAVGMVSLAVMAYGPRAPLPALLAAVLAGVQPSLVMTPVWSSVGALSGDLRQQITVAGRYIFWEGAGTCAALLGARLLAGLPGGHATAFAAFAVTFAACSFMLLQRPRLLGESL